MTIYLPDDLAAEVKAELGDINVSAVCQAALRAELDRQHARAEATAEGFERVEVFAEKVRGFGRVEVDDEGTGVAFQGREIAYSPDSGETAWFTPGGKIAIYSEEARQLNVYDDYAAFDEVVDEAWPRGFKAKIAEALGEKYVRELDI